MQLVDNLDTGYGREIDIIYIRGGDRTRPHPTRSSIFEGGRRATNRCGTSSEGRYWRGYPSQTDQSQQGRKYGIAGMCHSLYYYGLSNRRFQERGPELGLGVVLQCNAPVSIESATIETLLGLLGLLGPCFGDKAAGSFYLASNFKHFRCNDT